MANSTCPNQGHCRFLRRSNGPANRAVRPRWKVETLTASSGEHGAGSGHDGPTSAKVGDIIQEMPRVVGTGSESDIPLLGVSSLVLRRCVGFLLRLWQHPSMIPWVSLLRRQNEGIITDEEVTIPRNSRPRGSICSMNAHTRGVLDVLSESTSHAAGIF